MLDRGSYATRNYARRGFAMLQNLIFLLAGVIYFIVTNLAHRQRVQRWRNTVEYSNSHEASDPVGAAQKRTSTTTADLQNLR